MTQDNLNKSVAEIVVALIQSGKITVKEPSNPHYEEVTSVIKRVKAALSGV
jgi:hypothetical protein